MILALLLQAIAPATPAANAVTLDEAKAMAPPALAARLLGDRAHGPIVHADINYRFGPPTKTADRIWLVERMVPFDAATCRSHVYEIELKSGDPDAKPWTEGVPTRPVAIAERDRLWVPRGGKATAAACAAAPADESGFSDGGLGLERAAALVAEARAAFALTGRPRSFNLSCRGERDACGKDPRQTLAAIDWGMLGLVEQVQPNGEPYFVGGPKPDDAPSGPAHVQFTFPYAAGGATWEITVKRSPRITAVRMEAAYVVYH